MDSTDLKVQCYSGHAYADRPVSFDWRGEHYDIATIERSELSCDERSGVSVLTFLVTTTSGRRFRLSYEDRRDRWSIEETA